MQEADYIGDIRAKNTRQIGKAYQRLTGEECILTLELSDKVL